MLVDPIRLIVWPIRIAAALAIVASLIWTGRAFEMTTAILAATFVASFQVERVLRARYGSVEHIRAALEEPSGIDPSKQMFVRVWLRSMRAMGGMFTLVAAVMLSVMFANVSSLHDQLGNWPRVIVTIASILAFGSLGVVLFVGRLNRSFESLSRLSEVRRQS